jgi:hypothetical protein
LAALIHPVFMLGLCYSLLAAPPLQAIGAMHAAPVFVATLLGGYASTIAIDVIGLRRRRLLAHAWVLVLTPLYWFLLSLAAWRALFQLLYDPQRREKTEHGLAKSSRISGAGLRSGQSLRPSPITDEHHEESGRPAHGAWPLRRQGCSQSRDRQVVSPAQCHQR